MRILRIRDSADLPKDTPLLKSRGEIQTRSLMAQMQAPFTSFSMPTVGQGTQVTTQGGVSHGALLLSPDTVCPGWHSALPGALNTADSPCTHLSSLTVVPRPVILDPADPTGNVAGEEPQSWQLLEQAVRVWLRCSCCKNSDGTPVSTWDVLVTPPDS